MPPLEYEFRIDSKGQQGAIRQRAQHNRCFQCTRVWRMRGLVQVEQRVRGGSSPCSACGRWGRKAPEKRDIHEGAFMRWVKSKLWQFFQIPSGGRGWQRKEESEIIGMRILEGMWSRELQFKLEEAIKRVNGSTNDIFQTTRCCRKLLMLEMF